jgi:hypothetical protein
MIQKFAEKERLKDQLLDLIKRGKKNTFKTESIEPAANILIHMFDIYEELLEEQTSDVAGNYLFDAIAGHVLTAVQLTKLNKKIIATNELLIRIIEGYEKDK